MGESGCGKTTTGKLILQLENPTEGQIFFQGDDVSKLSSAGMTEYRKSVQAVFQDPWASLNPRMTVGETIAEPMVVHRIVEKTDALDKSIEILKKVGLTADYASRYPHELSGGQRQRIGIARALVLFKKWETLKRYLLTRNTFIQML